VEAREIRLKLESINLLEPSSQNSLYELANVYAGQSRNAEAVAELEKLGASARFRADGPDCSATHPG